MTQTRGRSRSSGPAAVDRYLLPREREKPIITVRKHPAILIMPITLAVAGLVAAFLLTATVLQSSGAARYVVWLLWVGLALNLVWKATNWAVDYFVVTSQRMMLTSGILTRKVGMMPLQKVTDMSFQRSFAGRVLGYGEFIVESAGQDQALSRIDHLPYPEHLYLEVCEMLWPQTTPDCKMCNGSGNVMMVMPEERKLRAFPCPNCDGTGKAPPPGARYEETLVDDSSNPNNDPSED